MTHLWWVPRADCALATAYRKYAGYPSEGWVRRKAAPPGTRAEGMGGLDIFEQPGKKGELSVYLSWGVVTMSLTLGACTYSWLWDAPLAHAVRSIAAMGFRYFELMTHVPHCWPRGWSAADRGAFRTLYESHGLRLTSLNPTYLDLNLASPNPGIRDESVRQLRETIQLAHDVGAGMVVVIAGRKHALIAPTQSHLWDLVKEGIQSLLEDCDRWGVNLGLENAYNVAHTAELTSRLCREISHPRLKLVYDVANATMVESPLAGCGKTLETGHFVNHA